jgi:hypothetical protein
VSLPSLEQKQKQGTRPLPSSLPAAAHPPGQPLLLVIYLLLFVILIILFIILITFIILLSLFLDLLFLVTLLKLISFLLRNKNPLVLHLLDLVDLAYLFLYLGFGPAVVF